MRLDDQLSELPPTPVIDDIQNTSTPKIGLDVMSLTSTSKSSSFKVKMADDDEADVEDDSTTDDLLFCGKFILK